MKKILTFVLLFVASNGLFAQINTPNASPATTIVQELGLTKITLNYSRPSVKGRKIFGSLVPYGSVWRTGANQITAVKFDNDVKVEGKMLKAGSYGLYTIPGQKTWKIIFNSDDKQWGAYAYDASKDVMSFEVPAINLPSLVENMSISFVDFTPTSTYIQIAWEKSAVKFKVEQEVHDQIMASIKEQAYKADASEDVLFAAADYYYEHNANLDQALVWAQKVLDKDQKYWTYQLVARIAAKAGKCEIAVPNAEKSLKLATDEKDDAYVLKNKAVLEKCNKKK